jgi:hypothetical protein
MTPILMHISRWSFRLQIGDRAITIAGELCIGPIDFLGYHRSIRSWESPHEDDIITDDQRDIIMVEATKAFAAQNKVLIWSWRVPVTRERIAEVTKKWRREAKVVGNPRLVKESRDMLVPISVKGRVMNCRATLQTYVDGTKECIVYVQRRWPNNTTFSVDDMAALASSQAEMSEDIPSDVDVISIRYDD